MVLLPFTESLVAIGALQGLGGLGRGILNTVCIGLAIRSATGEERATAMGAYQATYAIGMLAGPAVAGPIVGAYGIEAVFWLCAAMTVAGVGIVLARRMP
jgi:MFS family permease